MMSTEEHIACRKWTAAVKALMFNSLVVNEEDCLRVGIGCLCIGDLYLGYEDHLSPRPLSWWPGNMVLAVRKVFSSAHTMISGTGTTMYVKSTKVPKMKTMAAKECWPQRSWSARLYPYF